eukprot:Hpha_TRINITY_DN15350_c2_g1::TRINITY_DN15350_c2_g1_i2::g.88823::m.88823
MAAVRRSSSARRVLVLRSRSVQPPVQPPSQPPPAAPAPRRPPREEGVEAPKSDEPAPLPAPATATRGTVGTRDPRPATPGSRGTVGAVARLRSRTTAVPDSGAKRLAVMLAQRRSSEPTPTESGRGSCATADNESKLAAVLSVVPRSEAASHEAAAGEPLLEAGGWGRLTLPPLPSSPTAPVIPPRSSAARRSSSALRKPPVAVPAGPTPCPTRRRVSFPDDILREYICPAMPLGALLAAQRVNRSWRMAALQDNNRLRHVAQVVLRDTVDGWLAQCDAAAEEAEQRIAVPVKGAAGVLSEQVGLWLSRSRELGAIHARLSGEETTRDLRLYLRCCPSAAHGQSLRRLHELFLRCGLVTRCIASLQPPLDELAAVRLEQKEGEGVPFISPAGEKLYTTLLPRLAKALRACAQESDPQRLSNCRLSPAAPMGYSIVAHNAAAESAQVEAHRVGLECLGCVVACVHASYCNLADLLQMPASAVLTALCRLDDCLKEWSDNVANMFGGVAGLSPSARSAPSRRELKHARSVVADLQKVVREWENLAVPDPAISSEEALALRGSVLDPLTGTERRLCRGCEGLAMRLASNLSSVLV